MRFNFITHTAFTFIILNAIIFLYSIEEKNQELDPHSRLKFSLDTNTINKLSWMQKTNYVSTDSLLNYCNKALRDDRFSYEASEFVMNKILKLDTLSILRFCFKNMTASCLPKGYNISGPLPSNNKYSLDEENHLFFNHLLNTNYNNSMLSSVIKKEIRMNKELSGQKFNFMEILIDSKNLNIKIPFKKVKN